MKDLHIGTIETIDGFRQCLAIQRQTWRFDDLDIVPLHVLVTAAQTGGLVLGAWVKGQLVGFVLGFSARDSDGIPYHHSHMAAVLPAFRNLGIGYALKQEQARHVSQQGIALITWTFDPLETRNAHFNFNRLGAFARIYHINHYGILEDGLNKGLETDRFEVELWLNSARVQVCLRNPRQEFVPPPAEASVVPANWQRTLPQPPVELPGIAPPGALIEVPADFQKIKQIDMALARSWRQYFRHVCQLAFTKDFAAVSLQQLPSRAVGVASRRNAYLFRLLSPSPVY